MMQVYSERKAQLTDLLGLEVDSDHLEMVNTNTKLVGPMVYSRTTEVEEVRQTACLKWDGVEEDMKSFSPSEMMHKFGTCRGRKLTWNQLTQAYLENGH